MAKSWVQQRKDDAYDRYVTRLAGSTNEEYGHLDAFTPEEALAYWEQEVGH